MTIGHTTGPLGQKPVPRKDRVFDNYRAQIQRRFTDITVDERTRLFTTDVEDLFTTFLKALPDYERQYHNCNACRRFINTFGALVSIAPTGELFSPVWSRIGVPEPYAAGVKAMLDRLEKARITGVFFSDVKVWGTPVTGEWTHYAISLPVGRINTNRAHTAFQLSAEKTEDFKNVRRALTEFTEKKLEVAVDILKSDTLYRGDKLLGGAEWLLKCKRLFSNTKHRAKAMNLLWREISLAPAGFCHPRSGMLSTLLSDLEAGLPFATVKANFEKKMAPLHYQRPQAAPTIGNIAQAEKLVERMGLKASLQRRLARLDEAELFWEPKQYAAKGGVFGHLLENPLLHSLVTTNVPQHISAEKFVEKVLPTADSILLRVLNMHYPFVTLTTARDPSAPPLFAWDLDERRNPVAWYVHVTGSSPWAFGLSSSSWVDVLGISKHPAQWRGGSSLHGTGIVLFLKGAKDEAFYRSGLAIFPECLRPELHGVRATLEAFSKDGQLGDCVGQTATGLIITKGRADLNYEVLVSEKNIQRKFIIDRWE